MLTPRSDAGLMLIPGTERHLAQFWCNRFFHALACVRGQVGSRNEIQTIPTSKQTQTLPTLLIASKNEGPSHAGKAKFDKGPRTVSVCVVGYCVLSVPDIVVYPPPLDSDTHTSVALNLHYGIRGIRFPTDQARSYGKLCATDL